MSESFFPQSIPEISVQELAIEIAEENQQLQLIDVREKNEVEIASIKGFDVLPLSEYAEWSGEIKDRYNPNLETIVICHHGMRSAQMCQWLQNQGFTKVKNVSGGIDAYSIVIDPSVPRY